MTNSSNTENASVDAKSNPSFSIVPVENPGANITQVLFTGNNYDDWSRTFRLALLAKGKLDYIDGTIYKPSTSDPDYKSWRSVNALVCAWIFNSIDPDLRTSISLRDEATQLWADIKQRFTLVNDAHIYQLENDIMNCKQGPTKTVMAYYGRIKKLWDDLIASDAFPVCECNPCTCNLVHLLNRLREKKRVRSFLMGLDARYAVLRSHIIGAESLPSLNQIYSRLLQEDGMHTTLNTTSNDSRPDPMIYVAHASYGPRNTEGGGHDSRTRKASRSDSLTPAKPPTPNPPKPTYLACKRPGHSFKSCFRVTGLFPDWWGDRRRDRIYISPDATDLSQAIFVPDPRFKNKRKSNTAPRINMVSQVGSQDPSSSSTLSTLDNIDLNNLNAAERAELTRLWQSHKASSADRLNGNVPIFSWIIDTGASHHLSGCLSHFSNIRTISPLSVGLPNGDLRNAEILYCLLGLSLKTSYMQPVFTVT
ncbi:uncharacterized protein LOC141620650 [Silene latifolia]|uniref:uncharacterized protein LOC141620650 n=1 Tax=Silene latifolia TaxID=37657 RepID=UPI003D778161